MSSSINSDADRVVAEHAVQLNLLDAVHEAIAAKKSAEEIGPIFELLLDYSRIHFLSEELLMRLHAYEAYREHLQAHEQMVETMQKLYERHGDRSQTLTRDAVEELRAQLMEHITGLDQRLHQHVTETEHASS